tara:strand:+ start:4055 stop:5551 length:1497 start_codon:yes stop_codon:yes gene_type:complete
VEKNNNAERAQATKRDLVFISHATPGDNIFATWLGSRLTMAGYEVWCDQQKLIGGEDFWKDIEAVLRTRTVKFVVVISANAFDEHGHLRDGIAKEVALANILKKQIEDEYFIIPVRIDATSFSDFSIDFLRLNGIDCSANWADGFDSLVEVFERDHVPREENMEEFAIQSWRQVHKYHARSLVGGDELLQSNWLEIEDLPPMLHFYEIMKPIKSSEPRSIAASCSLPCIDHGRLLACFAESEEFQSVLGETIPIKHRYSLATEDFLIGETHGFSQIKQRDAKNKIASIVRQAWDIALEGRGLSPYEMANQKMAWWFPKGVPEDGQLRYLDFNGKARRRAVSGTRGKKQDGNGKEVPRYYWHLGFTGRVFLGDLSVIVLQPRVIISEDSENPLENKTRMNSVRRSLTSMWFNEKWRGLIMGFAAWLAQENEYIELQVSETQSIRLCCRPLTLSTDVCIQSDPVSQDTSDSSEEENERMETYLRMSDPAFILREDEEEEI